MILNNQVVVNNIEQCPSLHKIYLHQVGTVGLIDNLSMVDETIIGVKFLNDAILHSDYYQECMSNNIIPIKPHMIHFYKHNLSVI